MRRFIISRIIPLGFNAESMMLKMVQQPFSAYTKSFELNTPYKYYESVFYYNLAKLFPIVNFSNKYQQELYRQCFGKLEQLNQLDEVMGALSELDSEFYLTLHHSQMKVAGSNFVSFNINVEKQQSTEIEDAVKKYLKLVDALKGNELWLAKVKEEIGKYIHILYVGLEEGKKQVLFKDFDKHEYFV